MEEITRFGMKNFLTLPSLANKYFKSLRDENDETIYTYTDPFMRNFVRNAIKGGRCNAFNQHYTSEISDEVFNNISKELNVNGNICENLEKFFEFFNNFQKQNAKEFDSNMMIIEILIKKKKLITLTKNLTRYQFINSCLN